MPAISTTEIIGFNNQVVQYLEASKADLQTKGLDVTNWITELKAANTDTITKDAEQDALKTAHTEKVKETNAAAKSNYKMTSTRVDAVIGVLGKDTTAAKQFAKLRSDLLRISKMKPTEDKS
jgi:hypothetical protein